MTSTEPRPPDSPLELRPAAAVGSRTVTFVFTDIEGSTILLQQLGDRYGDLLTVHHRILRTTFGAAGGQEVDSAGDGLFFVFESARSAVTAAVESQHAIEAAHWPGDVTVKVRMGLHTGEPMVGQTGYVGIDVHRASRIAAVGHGGQILLSQTTAGLVASELPASIAIRDLGEHRLKDLARPEHLFQAAGAGMATDFGPLRSLDTMPNNLPRHLTSFVGRRGQIDHAKDDLRAASLLTFIGPSGVGKTRLSLQVAAEVLDDFADGVWVVELSTISDEQLVVPAIATALGLAEQLGRSPLEGVISHLQSRRILLVLDNCEHLVLECARFCDAALRSGPGLRIVATSREALGIDGERLFPVPSLSLPDARETLTAETVAASEAVGLFVERAALVAPGFHVTDRNAEAVVQICRRLDGIALALELAAARLRALTVEQIAARLDDRFHLLTGGSRVAMPRQQTLRAAIDWSHDLLPENERMVFRRLSVFAGPFTLDAAEAVCSGVGIDGADVLDLLIRLVDKSLVIADAPVDDAAIGGFRLLESIRDYAWERLAEAGEAPEAQTRHLGWFLALVEQAKPEFFQGPEPTEWLDRFDREHDNLRAALQFATSDPHSTDAGLALAAGLWRFWEIRGYAYEGRAWLQKALDQTAGDLTELRANALTGAAILGALSGDKISSVALHEESLAVHRILGNRHSISYAITNLANALVVSEDFEGARARYEEGLEMVRAFGDWHGEAVVNTHLAEVAERSGDHEAAQAYFDRSIAAYRAHDDPWGIANANGSFASGAIRRGDVALARALVADAITQYEYVGDSRGIARMLVLSADISAGEGDMEAARQAQLSSLALRIDVGDRPALATGLERLAALADPEDDAQAARILGAADGLRERIGAPRPIGVRGSHDQTVAALRSRLGDDGYREAWAGGRTAPLDVVLRELGLRPLR